MHRMHRMHRMIGPAAEFEQRRVQRSGPEVRGGPDNDVAVGGDRRIGILTGQNTSVGSVVVVRRSQRPGPVMRGWKSVFSEVTISGQDTVSLLVDRSANQYPVHNND